MEILASLLMLMSLLLLTGYTFVHYLFHRGLFRLSLRVNENAVSGATANPFVSVIIAARNEEKNIGDCLTGVLSQNYPADRLEVIVADDRSTDSTASIIKEFAEKNVAVKLVTISECPTGFSPKKHAVSCAVKMAVGEIILFTDADSKVPPTWISSVASTFKDEETVFASGLTSFYCPNDLALPFFKIQLADFLSHGVVSAAAITGGIPLNTNANNLAVRKRAFEDVGGYAGVAGVISGDDDLLLQRLTAAGGKAVFVAGRDSTVTTAPAFSLREWWEQRKRWGSKTVYYNRSAVILLSIVFAYYSFILICGIGALFVESLRAAAAMLFIHKTLLDALLFFRGKRLLGADVGMVWFWFLAPIHIPVVVLAVLFGVFGKFTWKDGPVKRKI
ncbi:MAG: glycosyltransferase [Fibrobacteres bacterium]|nr:glycosyltransferase [Fibrobacterota bacterium]